MTFQIKIKLETLPTPPSQKSNSCWHQKDHDTFTTFVKIQKATRSASCIASLHTYFTCLPHEAHPKWQAGSETDSYFAAFAAIFDTSLQPLWTVMLIRLVFPSGHENKHLQKILKRKSWTPFRGAFVVLLSLICKYIETIAVKIKALTWSRTDNVCQSCL